MYSTFAYTRTTLLVTAPIGTVSANEEVLVGYMGAGDYVRVDHVTGIVTSSTPGALGELRPSGDLTAFGTKGWQFPSAVLARSDQGAMIRPGAPLVPPSVWHELQSMLVSGVFITRDFVPDTTLAV